MESSETLKTRAVFVRPGYWVFTRRPRRKDRDVYNEREKNGTGTIETHSIADF